MDFTAASQRPPKCGALGGMLCHWIEFVMAKLCTAFLVLTDSVRF